MTRLFVGIDPGSQGAVAIIDENANIVLLENLPHIEYETANAKRKNRLADAAGLMKLIEPHKPRLRGYCVERPVAFVRNADAMLKLGISYGISLGVGQGIGPRLIITPTSKQWKTYFGLTADKETSKELARDSFLNLPKTLRDDKAEALLLALYALKQYEKKEEF